MIPAHFDLSQEAVDAGEQFLALLDEYGLGVQGAGWIHFDVVREWRYYIVTSLVDIDGLVETHDRISRLFALKFRSEVLTIDDLYLMSPKEPTFKTLSGVFKFDRSLIILEKVQIDNLLVERAVFYRALKDVPTDIKAKQARQQFDRRVKELERATTGPPK